MKVAIWEVLWEIRLLLCKRAGTEFSPGLAPMALITRDIRPSQTGGNLFLPPECSGSVPRGVNDAEEAEGLPVGVFQPVRGIGRYVDDVQ